MTEKEENRELAMQAAEQYRQSVPGLKEGRKRAAMQRTAGTRFTIPREGLKPVQTLLYRPFAQISKDRLPVLFNMHGGAWLGGDAVLMESFCQMMADELPAFVVNVNYTKADEEPLPYATREVADAVKYFADHAMEYGIDERRMAVGGHSAGAQLAATAALLLKDEGIRLACQMLVYPPTDLTYDPDHLLPEDGLKLFLFPDGGSGHKYISPLIAGDEDLAGVCPAVFIICGKDELKPEGIAYAKRLIDASVPVKVKEYPQALHGFLEVNRPDYPAEDERRTPEQEAYCRDCEMYLVQEIRACFREV